MVPRTGGHDSLIFMPAPFSPGDVGFYADAAQGELWIGPSHGLNEWSEALGLKVSDVSALGEFLCRKESPLVAGDSRSIADVTSINYAPSPELARTIAELRLVKDDWEIGEVRRAVAHTIEGFREVVAELPKAVGGGGERWLQGTFDRHARTVGNGVGYSTIVGGGAHAATLHWVRCDGNVRKGELILLDMGVEERSFYTADVTRTFPVSGSYTAEQRRVHDLVEKAHRAALSKVAPGRLFSDFHITAMEVIAQGLHDWGLLPVSVDEALSPEGQHHRRWLTCGVGHHLGLDVHDCASSSYSAYQQAPLSPGMVLTVEPGLYFHQHDLMVPPELRGIGVRIEDDLLLTHAGHENLSEGLPYGAAEIENWLKDQSVAERTGGGVQQPPSG